MKRVIGVAVVLLSLEAFVSSSMSSIVETLPYHYLGNNLRKAEELHRAKSWSPTCICQSGFHRVTVSLKLDSYPGWSLKTLLGMNVKLASKRCSWKFAGDK
ncbi:hypothetical protein C5167_012082 [Papaver somniferum]|uniref:Uncharacterized protein n=1 Tax=Papaver somniferum TaxID=3469 RepID=A0A4Y7IZK8_PAPSO|nr:hypothetical protein C5167_012082 [Papaver somniferum]